MTLPYGTDTGNRTTADPHRPFTLEPDRAFLGCLMQTPVGEARHLLAGVRPDDARSPIARQVLWLAIRLVADEIQPEPVVLLSAARNEGWLASEHRHQQFAAWLIETFQAAPLPEAATVVKAEMLEEALRWAITEQAQRVLELAEHGAIGRLREDATLDTDRIADLWQRLDTAGRAITPARTEKAVTGQFSASSDRLSRPHHRATPAHGNDAAGTAHAASAATSEGRAAQANQAA